jgi:hypothetical protein
MQMAVGKPRTAAPVRKIIEFDADSYQALYLLGRDTMKSIQELADEAFADLLKKHHRPVTLKQALRESARQAPANDPGPGAKRAVRPRQQLRRRNRSTT